MFNGLHAMMQTISGRSGDQLEDVVRCAAVSWCRGECGECYLQHLDTSPPPPVTSHRLTGQDTAQRRCWTFSKYGMETRQKVFLFLKVESTSRLPPHPPGAEWPVMDRVASAALKSGDRSVSSGAQARKREMHFVEIFGKIWKTVRSRVQFNWTRNCVITV